MIFSQETTTQITPHSPRSKLQCKILFCPKPREREKKKKTTTKNAKHKMLGELFVLGQKMRKYLNALLGPLAFFGLINKPKSKSTLAPIHLAHFLTHLLSSPNQNPTQFYLSQFKSQMTQFN